MAVLRLQRSAGNAVVAALLGHPRPRMGLPAPTVQRCGATAPEDCGCHDGEVDGLTHLAESNVQREAGVLDDGTVAPEQPDGGIERPLVRLGSKGQAVQDLQSLLNETGAASPLLEPDGDFGSRTQAAVLGFQSNTGLEPDGLVGPQTWGALEQQGLGAAVGGGGGATPGVGEGPPLVGGTFPGLGPLAPICGYEPNERRKSFDSKGQVDPPTSIGPTINTTALIFDFEPGRTTVRGNHEKFIKKLVADLKLNTPKPDARVQLLEGHTDCVDSEGVNAPIRAGRAEQVRFAFSTARALETNLGLAEGATKGTLPGDDSTAIGRARNRSVRLFIVDTPGPTPGGDGEDRSCLPENDEFSRSWGLRTTHEAIFGIAPLGKVQIDFDLQNEKSKCIYCASFVGDLEGGGGVSVSKSLPGGFNSFVTEQPMRPSEFTGEAARVETQAAFVIEDGFMKFQALATTPSELSLTGVTGGMGFDLLIVNSNGNFFVKNCETA